MPLPIGGQRINPDEFSRLYREHHRSLWYVAASVIGNKAYAEDVVQEAAIIAMNKLGEFDSSTSFPAWMSQIVRFVALNEGRKLQRRRPKAPEEILATLPADAAPPPHAAFDARVSAALAHLEERARTCLILRVVHGMSHAAIAATLGIPEGTVMSHVHRAKAALRRSLSPQNGGDA